MPSWLLPALVLVLLLALSIPALRRANRRIDTILEESEPAINCPAEVASEVTNIPEEDEEPNPERDWARKFLANTYGLNPMSGPESEDFRTFREALYDNSERPRAIKVATSDGNIRLVFTTAEILAKVLNDAELNKLVNSPNENVALWTLRGQGRLPRWVPPLLEPSLGRYHEELQRRLRAAPRR